MLGVSTNFFGNGGADRFTLANRPSSPRLMIKIGGNNIGKYAG